MKSYRDLKDGFVYLQCDCFIFGKRYFVTNWSYHKIYAEGYKQWSVKNPEEKGLWYWFLMVHINTTKSLLSTWNWLKNKERMFQSDITHKFTVTLMSSNLSINIKCDIVYPPLCSTLKFMVWILCKRLLKWIKGILHAVFCVL